VHGTRQERKAYFGIPNPDSNPSESKSSSVGIGEGSASMFDAGRSCCGR